MSDKDLASEIPDFVKKYVPGITRGLSWAKYSEEKQKGTEIKVDAYNESKEKVSRKQLAFLQMKLKKFSKKLKKQCGLTHKNLQTRREKLPIK